MQISVVSGAGMQGNGMAYRSRSPRLISRPLLLAAALAVFLPWLIRYGISEQPAFSAGIEREDVLGTATALLIGDFFTRRLVSYPGSRATYYILPVFVASYAGVLFAWAMFRFDYGRFVWLWSLIATLLCYYACSFLVTRSRAQRIGVVPEGSVGALEDVPGVHWVLLDTPSDPEPLDSLVADFRADLSDDWERYIANHAIAGTPVYHVKQIQEFTSGRVDIEHMSENIFGSLIPNLGYIKVKQGLDWLLALTVLMFAWPGLLILALIVKFDSPGPILFKQQRIGYRGRPIMVYKFRTMRHDPSVASSDGKDEAITRNEDHRITRRGRLMRRTRLDELPQLINILRGEMSWIGPRPEAVVLSKWYEAEIPFYNYRHIVRPGISGWAQVNQGHVAQLNEIERKLQYDFYYVKYVSAWLDVLIALRTVRTMTTGFGSK